MRLTALYTSFHFVVDHTRGGSFVAIPLLVARSIFILLVMGRCILFLSCMDRERGEAP